MQIESGSRGARSRRSPASELSGYDKIALSVVRAIHFNTNAVIPLSVANRGNIRELADDDVVEVPCVVNANGARPMHVGAVPDAVRASAGAGEGLRAADRRRRAGAIDRTPRARRWPPIRSCRTAPPPTASSPSSRPYGDARSRHGPSAGHRHQHHRDGRRRPVPDDSVHGHRDGRAAHSVCVGLRAPCWRSATASSTRSLARRCPAAAVRTSICARPTVRSASGRLMAFVFIFQMMLVAPLSIAGGAVGLRRLPRLLLDVDGRRCSTT